MDRAGHIERPLPPPHEPAHDRDLSGKHRGEGEQAPQRRAPEFPDPGRAWGGNDWSGRGGSCGTFEGIHQSAFRFRLSLCPDVIIAVRSGSAKTPWSASRQRPFEQMPDIVTAEI